MNQLELCKKVDKILCTLYDNKDGDEYYLEWSNLVSPQKKGGLLVMEELMDFLEGTPDIDITEADLKFFKEFTVEGLFSNHVDDNWQETVYVSRHITTGNLVGVRSVYSSYGNDTPYRHTDNNGLTHCFPVRPIQSWKYGAHEPKVWHVVAEEVKDA